ncbi:MAG TPA: hypothetical protein VIX19_02195 [Terriglobales bacterium]
MSDASVRLQVMPKPYDSQSRFLDDFGHGDKKVGHNIHEREEVEWIDAPEYEWHRF